MSPRETHVGRNRPKRISYGPLVNDRTDSPSQVATLQAKVDNLAQTIAELQAQREGLISKRRRKLLFVGVAVSLTLHMGLLVYLALLNRGLPGGGSSPPVVIEFATLHDQELIETEEFEHKESQSGVRAVDITLVSCAT